MNNEKNTPVVADMEEVDDAIDLYDMDVGEDEDAEWCVPDKRSVCREKRRAFWGRVRAICPVVLVWVRYLLPVATALALVVMGFFKTVRFAYRAPLSLWRLIWNTIVSARDYLGGEMQEAKSWFYGILSITAMLELLLALVALFLVGFAAYTAIRSFVAGYKSEESNRLKVAFKVAFPNRVCLYLANLLLVLPALYPHIFSLVSTKFLLIGGEEVVYVIANPLLFVMGACALATLVLAIAIRGFERRLHMNMFVLYREEDESQE